MKHSALARIVLWTMFLTSLTFLVTSASRKMVTKSVVNALALPRQQQHRHQQAAQQRRLFANTKNTATATTTTVDIHAYLNNIESEIYKEEHGNHMKRKLSEPNRKPIIRTLLGFDTKANFDEAYRNAQRSMEYERMFSFCNDHLLPRLKNGNGNDGREEPEWKQKVPDLPLLVSEALKHLSLWNDTMPSSSSSSTARLGVASFRKLGTGPIYKGSVEAMIADLFPDTMPAYEKAVEVPSDSEILQRVCELRRPILLQEQHQGNKNNSETTATTTTTTTNEEMTIASASATANHRLEAALKLCRRVFPQETQDDEESITASPCPKKSGRECEQACISFLEKNYGQNGNSSRSVVVLQNVYVNHKSSNTRFKYNVNRRKEHRNNSNSSNKNKSTLASTGIIWTSIDRENTCSEFDNVIVDEESQHVVEIWEAKSSISPSTLWDAVSKKLSAVRELVHDDDAFLMYGDEDQSASIGGTDGPNKISFGVYGRKLLAPSNAVGQLKAMAASKTLTSDIGAILNAVECGFVEVDTTTLLSDLNLLRMELEKANDDFHVIVNVS